MTRTTPNADETVTVRLPKGTADRLRAATGMKFSTLVRWMCNGLLEQYAGKTDLTDKGQEVKDFVQSQELPK